MYGVFWTKPKQLFIQLGTATSLQIGVEGENDAFRHSSIQNKISFGATDMISGQHN